MVVGEEVLQIFEIKNEAFLHTSPLQKHEVFQELMCHLQVLNNIRQKTLSGINIYIEAFHDLFRTTTKVQ